MGQEFEVRKEVTLPATPAKVWEAIATGPGLAAWFMPMEIDPVSAMVTAWEPGKRLAIETPPGEDGGTHAFEYLIEAREGGSTVLRFVHSGILGDDWGDEFESMTSKGWDMYLHTLAEYLEHFPGRPATYIEADAPQSSAEESAWPVLVGALGLSGPLATGDPVRLTPDGLAPIDGVVDYVTPDFLGVRAPDALYRFHGRAPIGMPIAVGHHLYRPGVDAEHVTQDWKAWLYRVFA
jgi:uncharacterized protein YndB with AHSA1/START domain